LVTTWHVLAGRRTDNGRPLHVKGAIFDRIKIGFLMAHEERSTQATAQVDLMNATGANCWLQHPAFGQEVDVAALYVGSDMLLQQALPLNQIRSAP
jgi:hypothetical protein